MHLLLVEDETILRDSLAQQLKDAGFTVDTAPDGEEGLYQAKEFVGRRRLCG
jgi:two-component system response regulator PhoP